MREQISRGQLKELFSKSGLRKVVIMAFMHKQRFGKGKSKIIHDERIKFTDGNSANVDVLRGADALVICTHNVGKNGHAATKRFKNVAARAGINVIYAETPEQVVRAYELVQMQNEPRQTKPLIEPPPLAVPVVKAERSPDMPRPTVVAPPDPKPEPAPEKKLSKIKELAEGAHREALLSLKQEFSRCGGSLTRVALAKFLRGQGIDPIPSVRWLRSKDYIAPKNPADKKVGAYIIGQVLVDVESKADVSAIDKFMALKMQMDELRLKACDELEQRARALEAEADSLNSQANIKRQGAADLRKEMEDIMRGSA